MSASALLSLGSRAMNANLALLQTTGHNIANANTPGYSRQSVDVATAGGQWSGSGFFGKGVDVVSVTRAHSDFLTREATTAQSAAAADAARSEQLQRLEPVFQTGAGGLGYAAANAFNAFADVATNPQDASARQVVLGRVDDLAAQFRDASAQIDAVQSGVAGDLRAAVASANSLTQRIATLNDRIAKVDGSGQPPNDLLDQRDSAIGELGKLLQVSTVAADNGSVSVFLGGGQKLVLGSSAVALAALPDAYDPAKVQIGITEAGVTRPLAASFVTGGSISGLLQFQSDDLPDARAQLGQLAASIAGRLNQQQALGLDLRTPAGSGGPLLSVGAPRVAPASTNAQAGGVPVASLLDSSGARVPSVSLTVVDSDALQASDYQLFADPANAAGTWTLTRLSDGTARTVASGDVVDGFRIDVASPAPAARDRFLLQPVSSSIASIRRALDDPKGLAAASPVTATVAATNTGTASIASIAATSRSINPNLTATITFTNGSGAYIYSLVDTTGATPTSTGTGTWTAGTPISLDGWSLELRGVPQSGDALTVQKTAFPASDNGNANALLELRDIGFVGRQTGAGGAVVPGQTTTEAYASVLAGLGVRVQGAKASAEQSAGIATEAKTRQDSVSGVNLDEEAARLIQYQQSYQAAAKLLQVAQNVFDSLLRAAG